jgi:flavorubredoxin
MRVAIIYAPRHDKLERAAKALGKAVEQGGHRIEYLHIGHQNRPLNIRKYDYVYLGSVCEGTFGGKVPTEVGEFVRQCRGFENSKSAAFLLKKMFGFANNKGLKRLMGVLESMGSQVMDFQLVGHPSDAALLGKRLQV